MCFIYEVEEEEEEDVEEGRTKLRWCLCFVCFLSLPLSLSLLRSLLSELVFFPTCFVDRSQYFPPPKLSHAHY